MRKKLIIFSWALVGIILAGILLPTNVIAQSDNATLQFDPMTMGLKPGSKDTISITTDNVRDLYAMEFHLSFNPQLIEVVDADPSKDGVQIASADVWKEGFIAINKVDNIAGKIDFAVTLLNPAQPIAGKQTVAAIMFNAKNDGISQINIDSAILTTRDAQQIQTTQLDGFIGVNAAGTSPDAQAELSPDQVSEDGFNGISKRTLAAAAIIVFLLAIGVFGFSLMRQNK